VLEVRAIDEERLALRGLDPGIALCLARVPDILGQRDSGAARARLYPDPTPTDPARSVEWHRLMDTDLRHLFEAAAETFRRDLGLLDIEAGEVVFPRAHAKAWMSAINQARLVLAEVHGLDERAMARAELDPSVERDAAVLQVQILGYVLQTLVQHALDEGHTANPDP